MAAGYDISASVSSAAKSGGYGSFSLTDYGSPTTEAGATGASKLPWIVLGVIAAAVLLYFWKKGGK